MRLFYLIIFLTCIVTAPFSASSKALASSGIRIHEITMAAPDIIAVEIRDMDFRVGRIIELDAPASASVGSWISYKDEWGMVIGPDRRHLRISDTPPDQFLDRAKFLKQSNYQLDGAARVVAVYRKSVPYSSGFYRGDSGATETGASFKHTFYLKLDQPLSEGKHTITWPEGVFPPTDFVFDTLQTRAIALRSTFVGHRPEDPSKIAYLALWLPEGPKHGAVDFRKYGIDTFSLIDETGLEVFTAPVSLRSQPDDPEPSNGLPQPLIDYAEGVPFPVTAIRPGAEPYIMAPGHELQTGQRVALQRLRGEQDAKAVFATIASTDADGFTLSDVSEPLPDVIEPGANVSLTYKSNRAGTYVFELDYSAWHNPGKYRLRLPGIGVSDTFEIADDRWMALARNGMAGLYNHRSGIPLDNRFGFERPEAFRPGPKLQILESNLPLVWTPNWYNGFVPFEEGSNASWVTTNVAPDDYWGGYMDAGDWDRRIQHLSVSEAFLELDEFLPANKRAELLGIPKSSELLPGYESLDGAPDLLHEAVWNIDFYRRLQLPDGSVRGGIESTGHPLSGSTSFLEHLKIFTYAPDHISTYRYAASAARLARLLREAGQQDLSETYRQSALKAWDAAERGFENPDEFYARSIEAGTKAGTFSAISWEDRKAALQKDAEGPRIAAAASLFRLDNNPSFATLVETAWKKEGDVYFQKGDGAWDYHQSGHADPTLRDQIEKAFVREAGTLLSVQSSLAYPSMKHPYAPAGWGQGGPPDFGQTLLLFRAYQISGDVQIIRLLQQTMHGLHGANQLGISFTTGIGPRQIEHPLHEDHRAMGVAPPPGITIYGWAPQNASAYGWVFGPSWSPLAEVGRPDAVAQRKVEPDRFALPFFEYLIEHPAIVIQQEYTVDQTIGPVTFIALFLDAI